MSGLCDRGANYAVKQMRYSSCIGLCSALFISCCSFHTMDEREDTMDEREDTMDEREVHTSLVNIAYSGASTRNNIY